MKNQYFGGRNDHFKYDLLIFLAEQLAAKNLSVVWMRTEDDRSNDGQKIDYGRGVGDRVLYEFLKKALVGKVTEHHQFLLKALMDQLIYLEGQIERFNQRIEQAARPFEKAITALIPMPGYDLVSAQSVIRFAGKGGVLPANCSASGL